MKTKSEQKPARKKRRKILIQLGIVIVLLSAVRILVINNMITMSSFSTAVSNELLAISDKLYDTELYYEFYPIAPWLFGYWSEHAEEMKANPVDTAEGERLLKEIYETYHIHYDMEITQEMVDALDPEEQAILAAVYHTMLQYEYKQFLGLEELGCDRVLTVAPGDSEDEAIVLLDSDAPDDELVIGEIIDMNAVRRYEDQTSSVQFAKASDWAWHLPGRNMVFAKIEPLTKSAPDVKMIAYFHAGTIYDEMDSVKRIRRYVLAFQVFSCIVVLGILYWIVMRPLAAIKKCVSEYAETKDADQVTQALAQIHSRNEIGVFADEFAAVAREMDRYTKEIAHLAGEQERVLTELNVASAIQLHMLPGTFPDNPQFRIYATTAPAKVVGGDFYDFYFLDEDHLVLTIADASGKGVPAAMFTLVCRTMLRDRTLAGGTPSEILTDVNNRLCEGNESSMFVTAWLGILTISTGELVCANAAHDDPVLRLGDKPFQMAETGHGLALGMFEGAGYQDETFRLAQGDAVFVYTDGVPEATRADDTMFELDRLAKLLESLPHDAAPHMILDKTKEAVDSFVGDAPQFDDMTMLCLVYHGSADVSS